MKAPTTKLQLPNPEIMRLWLILGLEFGVGDLFGDWNLGFGALRDH
jgi:hypothetical protein